MNGQPVDGLPHDIRGLIPYRPSFIDYWPWMLGAVAAALLLGLAWIWWSKRRAKKPTEAPVDPWDLLQQRLARLTPQEPFDGSVREAFFYDLSLGLREAIERRTGVRATDMTLAELREPLHRKLPLPSAEIEAVLGFLQRADLVKFAEAAATRDEALAASRSVQGWTSTLRPQFEVATASGTDPQGMVGGAASDLGFNLDQAGIFATPSEAAGAKRAPSADGQPTRRGSP